MGAQSIGVTGRGVRGAGEGTRDSVREVGADGRRAGRSHAQSGGRGGSIEQGPRAGLRI